MGLEKILRGIKKYEETIKPSLVQEFKRIKDNPQHKAVLFSCMDSRILLTRLMHSNVGDHFLVRNAGNLIPHHDNVNYKSMTTEPGALELGCVINNIQRVIVCGHSDCKAMGALFGLRDEVHRDDQHTGTGPLQLWLKLHGAPTVRKYDEYLASGRKSLTFQLQTSSPSNNATFTETTGTKAARSVVQAETIKDITFEAIIDPENKFADVDKFSQINTLMQLEHIASFPFLHEKMRTGQVLLSAMWFDVYTGDFYMFSRDKKQFLDVADNYDLLLTEAKLEEDNAEKNENENGK